MNFRNQEDRALLQACLEGQSGAWDEFVRRFSKLVYWSIGRVLKDSSYAGRQDLIDDLFQDVFRKILEKKPLSGLRDSEGLKKYLVVLSTHTTLDRIKASSRAARQTDSLEDFSELAIPAEGPDPLEAVQMEDRRGAVAEVLASLKPRERACLEFFVWEGMGHREIGLLVGLETEAVSSVIKRAKNRVREKLLEKGIKE